MIEAIENFVAKIFAGNSYFATFFISMIPFLELKGAIPFGMSKEVFGGRALSPFAAWMAAATGSLVPAFILVWLFVPVVNWLKRTKGFKKLSASLEDRFSSRAGKIDNQAKKSRKTFLKKCIGLIIFVAVPLPLTGAYTGSAIASYLGLGYLNSLLCIFIGNIIAGGIVVLLCTIFAGYEKYVLLSFILLLILLVAIKLLQMAIKKKKANKIS